MQGEGGGKRGGGEGQVDGGDRPPPTPNRGAVGDGGLFRGGHPEQPSIPTHWEAV